MSLLRSSSRWWNSTSSLHRPQNLSWRCPKKVNFQADVPHTQHPDSRGRSRVHYRRVVRVRSHSGRSGSSGRVRGGSVGRRDQRELRTRASSSRTRLGRRKERVSRHAAMNAKWK